MMAASAVPLTPAADDVVVADAVVGSGGVVVLPASSSTAVQAGVAPGGTTVGLLYQGSSK